MSQQEGGISYNPNEHVPAKERIKAFRDLHPGYTSARTFLGINNGYVGYTTEIFDEESNLVSNAHCWKKVTSEDDFQKAETISFSRAVAFLGILIDKDIASKEELELTLPHEVKDETLENILKAGKV